MLEQYEAVEQKTKVCNCFTFNSCKEYENVREQHEALKQIREQAKEELKNLKEQQSPVTKKIQETEEAFKSLDMKIRQKVGILSPQLTYVIFQVFCVQFLKCKAITSFVLV